MQKKKPITQEQFLKELKEPEEYIGFMLWQASNVWQRLMKSDMKEFSATYTQFIILFSIMYLSHKNRTINQKLIARHAKLDIMTVSDVLKTLVAKELVIRTINPKDRRNKSLRVSETGAQLVYKTFYKVESSDTQFFSVLGEEESKFNELLTKLIKGNYDKIFHSNEI